MTEAHAIAYQHDGVALKGEVVVPRGKGPHRAILVMSNAHGLGEQARRQANSLAALGYIALATDMYGGGIFHCNPKDAGGSLGPLLDDPARLRARVLTWYEVLKARPDVDPKRIAAIGYCFGGMCVLELARSGADVKCVTSFHGLLKTTMKAQPGSVRARVAVFTGGKDPYAPPADVDAFKSEMVAAGARWQITVFGEALHAFTDRSADTFGLPGLGYDPVADRVSWAATLALLDATL